MHPYKKLEGDSLEKALQEIPDWQVKDGKLHREFKFGDFSAAMAFMMQAALAAHLLDHHPEWCNVYNRVTVNLVTHYIDAISDLDFALAIKMDQLAS